MRSHNRDTMLSELLEWNDFFLLHIISFCKLKQYFEQST